MHSFTLGSSAICRACAWGLKIEHCSVFVLSSRCRDESSLIRARRHKTVHSESRALVWGPSSIPPSFWVDKVELFVTVDIHSLLEVVQRLRGERHACLGRQWCVEEASTLPAPNYKTSEWVASLKLYVCLNDASGGGVDFELWRGARNDNSSPLSASALSLSTRLTLRCCLMTPSLVVQALGNSSGLSQGFSDIFKEYDISKPFWKKGMHASSLKISEVHFSLIAETSYWKGVFIPKIPKTQAKWFPEPLT